MSRSLTRAFDAAHGRTMCGKVVLDKQDVTRARASLRQHTISPTTNQAVARALCLHDFVAVQHLSCGSSNRLQYLKAQEHKVRARASQLVVLTASRDALIETEPKQDTCRLSSDPASEVSSCPSPQPTFVRLVQ